MFFRKKAKVADGDTSSGIKPKRKITRRKPGQKPSQNYFNQGTQDAIVLYQNEPDDRIKKQIYVTVILPAFDSLVENLINVYSFNVMYESKTDLKNECLEFLYSAVNKFDVTRGSKAFSYFNVVAKNWLTIKSKQNAKKVQTYISIDNKEEISKEDLELIENYQILPSFDDLLAQAEMHKQFGEIIDVIQEKVKTESEKQCVVAIKDLIKCMEDVDLLSKRAILTYLRELTGFSSKQLSIVLSSLKKHYKELRKTEKFEY